MASSRSATAPADRRRPSGPGRAASTRGSGYGVRVPRPDAVEHLDGAPHQRFGFAALSQGPEVGGEVQARPANMDGAAVEPSDLALQEMSEDGDGFAIAASGKREICQGSRFGQAALRKLLRDGNRPTEEGIRPFEPTLRLVDRPEGGQNRYETGVVLPERF